jgi:predicted nucleotidyltransferase
MTCLTGELVSMCAEDEYQALHELAELGREIERRRGPDPYPRPNGPPPSFEELGRRRDEIMLVARRGGATTVRVFGSVVHGDAGPGSDLDLLVDMRPGGLLAQAELQCEFEDLLGCPVHLVTTGGLGYAREHVRETIEREAVLL